MTREHISSEDIRPHECRLGVVIIGIAALLLLICGTLVWTAYTIIGLVDERHEHFSQQCQCASHLWGYTIALLLWTWIMTRQVMELDAASRSRTVCREVLVHMLVECGLLAWGWWELRHSNAAEALASTVTYKACRVGVYTHTICVVASAIAVGIWLRLKRGRKSVRPLLDHDSLEDGDDTHDKAMPDGPAMPEGYAVPKDPAMPEGYAVPKDPAMPPIDYTSAAGVVALGSTATTI